MRVGADGLLIAGEGPEARVRSDLNALWYQASIAIGHSGSAPRAGARKARSTWRGRRSTSGDTTRRSGTSARAP